MNKETTSMPIFKEDKAKLIKMRKALGLASATVAINHLLKEVIITENQ